MSEMSRNVSEAVQRLKAGGVVAFPTETVYGLGADALSPGAVAKVFALKGRPSNNPLIVHVTGPEMAGRVCHWDERAARLAREFWPGPLSIILPKRENVPQAVTAGGPGVAVRCPDHPVALALLFEFDSPLVGPSANKSGQVSPTAAEHVRGVWREDEVFVLEGGACRSGIESTVVLLREHGATVLRPGVIGPDDIGAVLGERVGMRGAESGTVIAKGEAALSPGLLARHYAPRTPASLMNAGEVEHLVNQPGTARCVVLASSAIDVPSPHVLIEMPADPESYAAGLYAALRAADELNAERMLIERPEHSGHIWDAIRDRLTRATARDAAS